MLAFPGECGSPPVADFSIQRGWRRRRPMIESLRPGNFLLNEI
jgi:hypothetical protein